MNPLPTDGTETDGWDGDRRTRTMERRMASESTSTANRGGRQKAVQKTDQGMLDRLDLVLEEAGVSLASEVRDGRLILSGQVDSEEYRQAALDVATALAEPEGLGVEDAIEVLELSPDDAFIGGDRGDDLGGGEFAYAEPDANPSAQFDPAFETEPDFTGDTGTSDPQEAAAEAEPYFPPTDPVVRPSTTDQQLAVVGGFEATATDDLDGTAGFDVRNDDDLAQAVHRELAEDALTIDLPIRVEVVDGVVVLRGEVPSLEDAENAEAVASRVGGVQEVREELTVAGLR